MKVQKELYRLDGPWRGKLAMAARPRGGDWLRDDMASWKRAGIDTVLSLLTPDEETDLGLREEAGEAKTQGMEFTSFPIPDSPDSKVRGEVGGRFGKSHWHSVGRQECGCTLPPGNRAQRVGGSLSAGEKGHEPGSCRGDGLGGARRLRPGNSGAARLD